MAAAGCGFVAYTSSRACPEVRVYCAACGKTIPEDARFCSYCAAPVTGATASGATASALPPTSRSELVRPRRGRWIAGVCLALAQHFGWDPAVVRVIWLLMFLFAGAGGLAYIILWIVIPNE